MRIAIVAGSYLPLVGGVEVYAYNIARYLSSRGHEVLVLARDAARESDSPATAATTGRRSFLVDIWRTYRELSRFRPGVIHIVNAGYSCLGWLAHTPTICRTAGNDFRRARIGPRLPLSGLFVRFPGFFFFADSYVSWQLKLRSLVAQRALPSADVIIANSQWTASQLLNLGVMPEKVRIMLGGVDMELFTTRADAQIREQLGIEGSHILLATIARLVVKKGIDDVLRALNLALKENPHLRYLVVGDGPERENLERLAERLGLSTRVHFLGEKSYFEVHRYFRACDIYVQPSKSVLDQRAGISDEGTMGRSYCEAGACGKPVIASPTGGVVDVVRDGVNGIMVPAGDHERIARAILRLANDADLRAQLGGNGARIAREQFSWKVLGGRFEELLAPYGPRVRRTAKAEKAEARILITGGSFANKGAEAMTLALCSFLNSRFPDYSVLLGSPDAAHDVLVLQNQILPVRPPAGVSLTRKALELTKALAPVRLPQRKALLPGSYRRIKAVIDVGGFASGDPWGGGAARWRWWSFHRLKSLGVPVIFMPQAWGPFDNLEVRFFTRLMLKGVALVFARDAESLEYLRELNVVPASSLKMGADIGLQFRGSPPEVGARILRSSGVPLGQRPVIGVTPNMRAYERCPGRGKDNKYVRMLADICRFFADSCKTSVVLIPHEIFQDEDADDRYLCELLLGSLRTNQVLYVLDKQYSSAELRSVIGHLDFLVGSRYHSVVGALSKRIAVTALGWSHKYGQLMESVQLGGYAVNVTGPKFEIDEIVELVKNAWEKREALVGNLNRYVPALERSSADALTTMAEVVSSACV